MPEIKAIVRRNIKQMRRFRALPATPLFFRIHQSVLLPQQKIRAHRVLPPRVPEIGRTRTKAGDLDDTVDF